MSKQQSRAYIFLGLFFILSLLPSLGMWIFGGSKAGANEILAPKPSLTEKDGSYNLQYFSELSDYLSDRVFLRQEAITLRNKLSVKLFSTSPSKKVTLGRDDWLFYAETLSGEALSEKELWCAAENLKLLQEAAESRGSEFLFVLCPNKSSLLPEAVGYGTPSEDGKRFEALLQDMGVAHSSLYDALLRRADCYYHTDSHWNATGAAIAADAINASLGRKTRYADGPFQEGLGHSGDLSAMLFPAAPTVETDWVYPFTFRYTSDYHGPGDPTIVTEGEGEGSLSCYRDSFGNDLHPFLAESFQRAVFSRKTAFDLTALDSDVLLIELVERNIDYLYAYDHSYPAPQRDVRVETRDAAAISCTLSAAGELTRISGKLESFDAAPLYLLTEGRLYECAPKSDGFTICVSEFREGKLLYQRDGQYYAAELETVSNEQ